MIWLISFLCVLLGHKAIKDNKDIDAGGDGVPVFRFVVNTLTNCIKMRAIIHISLYLWPLNQPVFFTERVVFFVYDDRLL